MLDRARHNGLQLRWLTFDEEYKEKPGFLGGFRQRKQDFVGEVPSILTGWLERPQVTSRPHHRSGRGRGRPTPRLRSGSSPARSLNELLEHHPRLRHQPWKRYHLRGGGQGPMVWEVKATWSCPKDENDLPGPRLRLLIACNLLNPKEIKYFLANTPPAHRWGPCCW